MKGFLVVIAVSGALVAPVIGHADIYRSDGDDDVIQFTDTPTDRSFRLVQKEQKARAIGKGKEKSLLRADTPSPGGNDGSSRVLPIQGRITSPTGMRYDPFDGKLRHHKGMDIAAPTGTPVKPVAGGMVMFSGWKPGYGNTVILEHDDGMVTVYAHHASNNVSVGEVVSMHTVIAHTGSTGRSTGPHLHFEAWRGGENITSEFMPGGGGEIRTDAVASAPINRYLQADGTIVFTNLR
jgi:murein DD-endopeptidase MepM/ murein hydrolase activator NlpD